MARQVQFRRGTTAQTSSFTGAVGEVTVDTDKNTAVVHDGSTAGGFPLVTDAGIDTHLNTSTATTGEFLKWTGSDYDWAALTAPNDATITLSAGTALSGGGDFTTDQSGNETITINFSGGINDLSDGYTASNSVGLGANALANTTSGQYNTAVGNGSGRNLTSGWQNNFVGADAGYNVTTAYHNFYAGSSAGYWNQTGGANTAIGFESLKGASGQSNSNNTAIGHQAGYSTTTGNSNTITGYTAGYNLTTPTGNSFYGSGAAHGNTTGAYNVAIGLDASKYNQTGNANIAVGRNALQGVSGSSHAANTAIGYQAGYGITTGGDNFFGGFNAGSSTTTGSNNTVIGNGSDASSATVSNEITLGNTSVTRFRIPGAGIDNTSAALSGTTPSADVGARDTYTLTTSGNTTFTFTGAPSSGQVGTFSLIITAGGAHTITWPTSVDWAGGTAPDAPASGAKNIYTFTTIDAGTTWYGFLAAAAVA